MKEQIESELVEIGEFLGARLGLVSVSRNGHGHYGLVLVINDKIRSVYLIPDSNYSLRVSLTYSVLRLLVWQ